MSLAALVRQTIGTEAASSVRARLARGAFWSVLNTAGSRALALAGAMILARLIGRERYGELGVIQSTVGVFGLLASLGTSVTATKFVAELRDKDPTRAGRIIALAIVVSLVSGALVAAAVLFGAPALASRTLAAPQLAPLVRISTVMLLVNAITGAFSGALAGFEAFRTIALAELVGGALGAVLSVAGALLGGLQGALIGTIAALAVQSLIYAMLLRARLKSAGISLVFDGAWGEARVLLTFSVPAVLAALVAGQVNWLSNALLVNQPGGYAQMGLFSAANQWRTAIALLPSTLGSAVLPILANLAGQRDGRRYARVLWASIGVNALLAFGAAAVVILFSELIVAGYGPDFGAAQPVLKTLACAAALAATVLMVGQALVSTGRMWWAFAVNALWAAVLLVAVWNLRTRGAVGLALAHVIAYGVHLVSTSALCLLVPRWLLAEEKRA